MQSSSLFNRVTAFIFIEEDVSNIQNLRNLAEQLLLQYFEASSRMLPALTSLLDKDSNDSSHIKGLISFLVKELKKVCVFIDGLDEAPNSEQWEETVIFLRQLAGDSSQNLKVWVSSQNTSLIRSRLEGFEELDSCQHDMSLDIKAYIDAKMPVYMAESSSESAARIHKIVQKKAEGSFLWATQMIELLKEADSEGERISMALNGLPKSTNDYYRRILKRVQKEDTARNNIVR